MAPDWLGNVLLSKDQGRDLSASSPLVLLELRILTNLTNKDYEKYQGV